MAFGAKKIPPINTRPGTAVGVSLPFNAPATFSSTYTTQDALRNNILNLLLTNTTERFLNNTFGGNLRKYIFDQITSQTIGRLEQDIQSLINIYFPNQVIITNISTDQYPDSNEIDIQIYYYIKDIGINDRIQITFS